MERRRGVGARRGPGRRPAAELDLDDVVYGIHAIDEALAAGETLRRIHVGDERKHDPAVRRLLDAARARGVTVRFESRSFFASIPYKAHQRVVAFGAPFDYATLEDAIGAARGRPDHAMLFVVLDHVTDPHNAGAIIRTAECAGADAVVLPERRAAGVNATVRKAAAGATAHIPIARVANVANALRTLKKAGAWIVGAALAPEALPYDRADLAGNVVIVVGAEGTGLSQVVARECDFLVRIPMAGRVASLNASVAAGILLYEAVRQRGGNARSKA